MIIVSFQTKTKKYSIMKPYILKKEMKTMGMTTAGNVYAAGSFLMNGTTFTLLLLAPLLLSVKVL